MRRAGAVAGRLADRERAGVVGTRGVALAGERRGAAEGEKVERDLARRAELPVEGERLLELRSRACGIAALQRGDAEDAQRIRLLGEVAGGAARLVRAAGRGGGLVEPASLQRKRDWEAERLSSWFGG